MQYSLNIWAGEICVVKHGAIYSVKLGAVSDVVFRKVLPRVIHQYVVYTFMLSVSLLDCNDVISEDEEDPTFEVIEITEIYSILLYAS